MKKEEPTYEMLQRYSVALEDLKNTTNHLTATAIRTAEFAKKHLVYDCILVVAANHLLITCTKGKNGYAYRWIYDHDIIDDKIVKDIYDDCKIIKQTQTENGKLRKLKEVTKVVDTRSTKVARAEKPTPKEIIPVIAELVPTFSSAHLQIIEMITFTIPRDVEIDHSIFLREVLSLKFVPSEELMIIKAAVQRHDGSIQMVSLPFDRKSFTLNPNKANTPYIIESLDI